MPIEFRRLPRVAGIVLLCGLLSQPARAAEPTVFLPASIDLRESAELALRHNPALRRAAERTLEQREAISETRAAGRPRLDAVGSYSIEERDRVGDFGGGSQQDNTSWNAGFEAASSLYSGGRFTAEVSAQTAREQARGAEQAATANDVLLETASRYFAALLARKNIVVQEKALSLFELQLQVAQNRFQAGTGPRFDVLQAEVALANARPPLVRARNAARVAVEELRQTIGLPYAPGQNAEAIDLDPDWPEALPLDPVEDAIAMAMDKHPTLRALDKELDAAIQQVRATRRQRAPSVQGFANYLFQNDRFAEGDDVLQGWGIGVRASLPIWDSAAIRSRTGQAEARLRQQELQNEETALAIEVDVRRAWFDVEQAAEILQTADLVIEQASEALRLAENRYAAGALTQLEVLQSQLALTQSLLERESAAHDFHTAFARLRHATGIPPIGI